jgi:hypothetical protein
MQNILYLTLKKPQFKVTLSGEKRIEYRRASQWIASRLLNKSYDLIRFVNGYGKDKPYFIVEFRGYEVIKKYEQHLFSNGLVVEVKIGDYAIKLGKIIETGNL